MHTEESKRKQLRNYGEWLIELSADESKHIGFVFEEIHACSCAKCGDYADDMVESLKVAYSSK